MVRICCHKFVLAFLFMLSTIAVPAQFRVIGYVHSNHSAPDLTLIQFGYLTHLNIAFVNPDSSGNLVLPPGFDSIVAAAHANKVKVLASIGGGSFIPQYKWLLQDSLRNSLVLEILQMAITHQLDGIDVDIENDNLDENYGRFVGDLSRALKPKKILLTAALATWNGEKIGDSTLKKFDFVNIMSYDQTGPWAKDKPGPHSTYAKAVDDLDYWTEKRKLKKKNLNLGLPFYGYGFDTQFGESMSYKDIITQFPGTENVDEYDPPGGGRIYYNGVPTITQKIALARKKAGGVMVWQLLQDASGEMSLLKLIYELK